MRDAKRISLRLSLVCIGTLFFPSGVTVAQPLPNSGWTVESIRAKVEAVRTKLRSVAYEAHSRGRVALTPQGEIRKQRHVVAIASGRRFVETQHLWPGLDWNQDLDWTRNYMRPGHMEVYWVQSRYAETSELFSSAANNEKLETIHNEAFLDCSGWWPLVQDDSDESEAPATSLHLLLRRDDASVDADLERLDGHLCAIVRVLDGKSVLWLDVEKSCALVCRHVTLNDGNYAVYRNSDFREMLPSVWLPWEMEQLIHKGPSPGEIAKVDQAVYSHAIRQVTNMRINDVEDEQFILSPLPGSVIVDVDKKQTQFVPGGTDLLDEMVEIGFKQLHSDSSSASVSRHTKRAKTWLGISIAWLAAATAVSFGMVARRPMQE